MQIPPELTTLIDEAISHYPVSKRSASLPLLHLFQEHFGYISEETILWIAEKLELQPIAILELVTFYPMFRRTPPGKHHIRVCKTLSCALAGAEQLKADLCKATGIPCDGHGDCHGGAPGHGDPVVVSADGKFSIESVECLASCGTGPVIMVNDDFYEAVTAEEIPNLLSQYK
ncbi:MAG: NAD(P)H-dependent oxidoreductase subunit E [Verrucomicrobia bacterium]|nr:NAD(P)H-dependent oxidoreductase subunit E [Verrucomicrobiota bacterium]